MPIAQQTVWTVECDHDGCTERYKDPDGVALVFESDKAAVNTAQEMDWDVIDPSQPAFCERHSQPRCIYCDGRDEHMVANAGDEPVCTECAKTEDVT